MAITLEKIAHLSGVSRSTVSRVLNGNENVKEDTRLKVQEVIRKINFQPNMAARILAAGKTSVIGLVIPAGVPKIFADPFFPQLIQGISTACNANNYSMMLWLADPAYESRTIRQILYGGLLDGVIISSMLIDDPIVQSLQDSQMPFILVGRHLTLDVNYLDVDNIAGGREATLHLLSCGRQRVATITGPQNMIAGLDRYSGYCKALRFQRMPIIDDLVVEGDFTEAGGYECMKKLIPFHPDAVFAASDTMAVGALCALRDANLSVPKDIAVVGFDDAPVASHSIPTLTTICQSTYKIGYTTLETLLEIIQNPSRQTRHVLLKTKLVIRASCGATGA